MKTQVYHKILKTVSFITNFIVSGESRRGGEDKMLDDLEKSVLKIYEECIGQNEASISTIDMLRHIELRMESLTQEQELLNPKKVVFSEFGLIV